MPKDNPADGGHSPCLTAASPATVSREADSSLRAPGRCRPEEMTQGFRTPSVIITFETNVAKSEGGIITEIPSLPFPLSHLPA